METFFTPWHGVLYSGYLAIAVFLLAVLVRNHQRGFGWQHALPAGYGLSLLGAGIFAIGGVLDLIWHVLFGIEKNVEALLSPTHLLLALGAVLMLSGPLRTAWQRPSAGPARDSRNLFPMLFSLAYILAIFTFFTQFANPIANSYADQHTIEQLEDLGIASILLQTALFMGGVLFVMRRWGLPLGAFTLIYTINSVVSSLMAKSSLVLAVAILACLTGLFIDLFAAGPLTPGKRLTIVLATAVPGAIWGWLYWRLGLLQAMLSHILHDCVGYTLVYILVALIKL